MLTTWSAAMLLDGMCHACMDGRGVVGGATACLEVGVIPTSYKPVCCTRSSMAGRPWQVLRQNTSEARQVSSLSSKGGLG